MTCPTRFRSFTLFHIELKFSFRVLGITIQTNNLIFLFLHNKVCIISTNKTYTSRASSIFLRIRKADSLYSLSYRPEDKPVKAPKGKKPRLVNTASLISVPKLYLSLWGGGPSREGKKALPHSPWTPILFPMHPFHLAAPKMYPL